MSVAAPVYSGLFGHDARTPESFWISLRFFGVYRIAVAAIFLGIVLVYGDTLNLGAHRLDVFRNTCIAYLAFGAGFRWLLGRWRRRFNVQLSLHVFTDIVATTVLMYASGGIRSGLGTMLLIALIAAALVAPRRLSWLYSALAAIAVLLEQSLWVLADDAPTAGYLQPALLAMAFFASSGVTNWLAQRVAASEQLAQARGRDLTRQVQVSQLVIEDMQDGVLVLDSEGRVTQHNPRAQRLLETEVLMGEELVRLQPGLRLAWASWRAHPRGTPPFDLDIAGRGVRARFAEAGAGADFSVLYLEDITRSREQAQQLKLAALGRLTANIAHEIRNPLSAISHASELLEEEKGVADRLRLTRIVRDNTQRLERLVSDVLQLSRRERVSADRIELGLWIPAFLDEFRASESLPDGRISFDCAPGAQVEFDREHLRQVLWNLLRNAVRHAPETPGSVRIEVRSRAHQVQLNVMDDGPGVPEAEQARLFEPFHTTDSKGTGLGLYLARELCATNRARLEYMDDMRGAHFRIRFGEAVR